MKIALLLNVPIGIVSQIPTDTLAGQEAAQLLELCLKENIEIDTFSGWTICIEYPDNAWSQDVSNLVTKEDRRQKYLDGVQDPILDSVDHQVQHRQDEIVCILHTFLAPHGIAAITADTWGFIIFGQPGRERIIEKERTQENIEFKIHLDQMDRLGLKSPLIEEETP